MSKTTNIWSFACRRLIVDEKSKLMSAVDIIDRLAVNVDMSKAPAEVQTALNEGKELEKPIQVSGDVTIASYWEMAKADRDKDLVLKTVIYSGSKKALADGNMEFRVPMEHPFHRTFVKLPSFPITGSGTYSVVSTVEDSAGKVLVKKAVPVTVGLKTA